MNDKEKLIMNRFLAVCLNIVILLAYVLYLRNAEATPRQPLDIPLGSWKTYYNLQYDEEAYQWHADAGQVNTKGHTVDLIYGPYVYVPKGFYTIEVDYECDRTQRMEPFANGLNSKWIKSSFFYLENSMNHVSCDMRVTNDIDNFELVLKYDGNGAITISNITITPNANAAKRGLLWVLLLLAIADSFLILRRRPADEQKAFVFVIGITLLASLPLFFQGIHKGHDLPFHLMRIEGLFREVQYGHFPVRISSLWGSGHGYPVSIFYGDILLYPVILLRQAGLAIYEAYKVFVFFVNLLSTIIAALCFCKMFKNSKTGLILTLVYLTAPYRMSDIYIRAAVGEYLSYMFIPVVAYALWQIYGCDNNGRKKNLFNSVIFALGMTGIITSHVLSTEMTVLVILLIIALQFKKTFTLNSLRTYTLAVLITTALSSYFIVPFLDYYLNVPVVITSSIHNGPKLIQEKGLYLADLLAFFRNPFGHSGDFLATPGIVLMATLILALVLWALRKASGRVKMLSALAFFMLWLSTNMFPWNTLAEHSKVFNMIAQIQFPWRFLVFAIILQVLLLGCLLEENVYDAVVTGLDVRRAGAWAVLCTVFMTLFFTSQYLDTSTKREFFDSANVTSYVYLTGEYLRASEDGMSQVEPDDFNGRFTSDHAQIEVLSRRGTDFDIVCRTEDEPAVVLAPFINYKGYVVYDDLGNVYEVEDGDNFMVSFRIPAGFNRVLHLRFEEPLSWTYALYFSCAAAELVLLYLVIHFIPKKNIKKKRTLPGSAGPGRIREWIKNCQIKSHLPKGKPVKNNSVKENPFRKK